MRLLIRLRAQADAAYDNSHFHELRGRLWKGLRGTEYDELHDAERPVGLSFSNVFPWGDIEEGDERTVLVAATDQDVLQAIAESVITDRKFNVGEMPFRVEEVTTVAPDVGEPGTRGTLETGTGVLVRIPPWQADKYGIENEGDEATFWQPEYSLEPFKTQLENNLDKKHRLFCDDHLPGPSERDGDLFDEYNLIKTFAVPVEVTQGVEMTYVLSKWRFGYRVRDDHHRRHLNLALDAGIGERNALGLGFLNIEKDSKQLPGATSSAATDGGQR
ncbi:CRISPR-associated endoribonuclease Cas6 [Halorussus sp. MSC15.2]|uniref:CRISPR-associated endoribonuclease Cas6 n=1 Tax=Halorussus sp. MSC15.2 TaxID=2283638 RepID=UPI0013CF7315|nr:CRISPR-associated endoribonuclease Cas6 [Halorussus sp. MSC15.2]NEU59281.1 CRISPR-associated endoribonuclease Cas6 [Halorussus sp. MSC15.2]